MDHATTRAPLRAPLSLLLSALAVMLTIAAARIGAAEIAVDEPLLEVRGTIAGAGAVVYFDRDRLARFRQVDIKTVTPWNDDEVTFSGPLLRDLLEAAGVGGERIVAAALDDYSSTIPIEDIEQYPVIVATRANGKPLRIRDRGPLWIIYPWHDFDELRNETYYSRSVWQLKKLTVH